METIPTKQSRAVWERVMARQGEPLPYPVSEPQQALGETNLARLFQGELASAAACSRLAQLYRGREQQTLLALARQEREHAAALRSVCYIANRTACQIPDLPQEEARSPAEILRQLYLQKQNFCKTYGELSRQEAAFGQIFDRLAQHEQQQAQTVFQILSKRLTGERAHIR